MAEGPDGPLQREQVYRQLFTESAVPSLILDVEHRRIVDVNPATEAFLGLAADDILGRPGTDFLFEPSPDQVLRARALRGQQTRTVRFVRTAAGERTAEISIVPLGPGHALVQAVDLTDLIEANHALEEQARRLEKQSAALQTVASRIAHDLRGPLAAITGYVELLIEDEHDDDKLHMLDRIRSNSSKLSEMIDRVLGEARVDAEEPEVGSEAETRSVARLFAAVRRHLEVQLAGVGGEGPELSTVSTVVSLPVPVAALEQPVVNLVSNSLKYRDPDRQPEVVLAVTAEPDTVAIEVTDNGLGLPEDAEPLFAAGARGDNASGTEGTGLGLAFAREAIEQLGGTLTGRAEADGSTFRIELPMRAPAGDGAHGRVEGPAPAGGSLAAGLSGRQLEQIIEHWPSPIVIVDLGTRRILRANVAASEVLGVAADDLVGKPDDCFFADTADADGMRSLALQSAQPGHFRRDVPIVAAGGVADTRVTLTTFADVTIGVLTITLPDPDSPR